MAPSLASITSTRYAIVVDAGSSGSRLQIYSWQDPEAERRQIVSNVQQRWRAEGGRATGADRKGKGRAVDGGDGNGELGWYTERALRRLVKVEKGVAGEDWVKRQEPGLSSQTPESLRSYFSPLLDHAIEHIPPSQHAATPIYILATAGMRLLPDRERRAILERTCQILRDEYPFQLDTASELGPCGESVRVISGEEEGMWGWVAVNYLMDGFGHAASSSSVNDDDGNDSTLLPLEPLKTDALGFQRDVPPTLVDPSQRSPTFGFLDMGGASTQIAFSPTAVELERSGYPSDALRSVSLRLLSGETVEWPVFVASWLGFGTNRVREKYEALKVREWQDAKGIEGGTLDLAVPSPSAGDRNQAILDPCLPASLYLESTSPQDRPAFLGTGSFSQCLRDLQPLLESSTPCPEPHNHCLFAGLPTPHIDFNREDQRGFIGISEYWYTAQQVLGLGGVWDWAEWEKGMSDFCARDWEDVQDVFRESGEWRGTDVERARLQMQCFKGAWISNVLHEGIGIPRIVDSGGNQTLTGGDVGETNEEAERRAKKKGLKSHFQSLDTVGETAISWTLGKMVIEASKGVKPHGYRRRPVGIAGKVAAVWSHGTDRLHDAIGLPVLEDKMAAHGIDATWAYLGFWSLLLAIFVFSRRRSAAKYSRRRKASDATWAMSTENYLKVEEQSSPPSKASGSGSLRRFGNRLTSTLRRLGFASKAHESRPRSRRHSTAPPGNLMTLHDLSSRDNANATYSTSSSLSLPPSPRSDPSFFTPAFNPTTSEIDLSTDQLSTPSSRGKMPLPGTRSPSGRRSNALNSPHSGTPSLRGVARRMTPQSHGGWNDPPSAIFESSPYGAGGTDASVLIPPAASGELGGMLSRNSSRISLVDAGSMNLNSRPVSRGPSDKGVFARD